MFDHLEIKFIGTFYFLWIKLVLKKDEEDT